MGGPVGDHGCITAVEVLHGVEPVDLEGVGQVLGGVGWDGTCKLAVGVECGFVAERVAEVGCEGPVVFGLVVGPHAEVVVAAAGRVDGPVAAVEDGLRRAGFGERKQLVDHRIGRSEAQARTHLGEVGLATCHCRG